MTQYRQPFDQPSYLYQTDRDASISTIRPNPLSHIQEQTSATQGVPVIEIEVSQKENPQAWCNGLSLSATSGGEGSTVQSTKFLIPNSNVYYNKNTLSTLSPWVVVLQSKSTEATLLNLSIKAEYKLFKQQNNIQQAEYAIPVNDASLPLTNDAQSFVPIVLPCLLHMKQWTILKQASNITTLLKQMVAISKKSSSQNLIPDEQPSQLKNLNIELQDYLSDLQVDENQYTLTCTWSEGGVASKTIDIVLGNLSDAAIVYRVLPLNTIRLWQNLCKELNETSKAVTGLKDSLDNQFPIDNQLDQVNSFAAQERPRLVKLKTPSTVICPKFVSDSDTDIPESTAELSTEQGWRSTVYKWINHLTPAAANDALWRAQLEHKGCLLQRSIATFSGTSGGTILPRPVKPIGVLAGTIPYQLASDHVCARAGGAQAAATSSVWYSDSRTALQKHSLVATGSDVQDYLQSSVFVGVARLLLLEQAYRAPYKLEGAAARMASEPWINRSTARALQLAAQWLSNMFGHAIDPKSDEWKVVKTSLDVRLYKDLIGEEQAAFNMSGTSSTQEALAPRLSTLVAMDLPCFRMLLHDLVYGKIRVEWTAACAIEMNAFCNALKQMSQRAMYGESLYNLPVSFLQASIMPTLRKVPNASKMAELVLLRQHIGDPRSDELLSTVEDLSRGFNAVTLKTGEQRMPKSATAVDSLEMALRVYERDATTPLKTRHMLATRAVESGTLLLDQLVDVGTETTQKRMKTLLEHRHPLAKGASKTTFQTYSINIMEQARRVPLWDQVVRQWSNLYLRSMDNDLSRPPPIFNKTNDPGTNQPPCLFYAPPGWMGGLPAAGSVTIDETPLDVIDVLQAIEDVLSTSKGSTVVVQASEAPMFWTAPSTTTLLVEMPRDVRTVYYRRINLPKFTKEDSQASQEEEGGEVEEEEEEEEEEEGEEEEEEEEEEEGEEEEEAYDTAEEEEEDEEGKRVSMTTSPPSSPDTLDACMWNIVRLSQGMLLAASFWYTTRSESNYVCTLEVAGATSLETAIALTMARSALGAVGKHGKTTSYELQARASLQKSKEVPLKLKNALLAWVKRPQDLPSRAISLATITMALHTCEYQAVARHKTGM